MSKIQDMRIRRGEIWDQAKAFLDAHQDENGVTPCLPVFRWLVCGLGTGGQTRGSAPTRGGRGFGLGLWVWALALAERVFSHHRTPVPRTPEF